jgi:F-type H+-transporting ATPase subunit b
MRYLISAAALLAASPALASDDGAGFGTVIWQAVNLGILLALLVYFAKKPIQRAMKGRAEGITREIDAAAAVHAKAKTLLDEYEKKIAALDAEAAALLEQYRAEGEIEKARLIAEGESEVKRLRDEASRTIASEVESAKHRLEGEVIDLAIEAAEQAIREKLTPADHRRLTSEYLSGLEEAAGA